MLFLIHAIVHPDLFLLHLVIEVTPPATIVGHTCKYQSTAKKWKDDAYPHYFTGAFMSQGYPARNAYDGGDEYGHYNFFLVVSPHTHTRR